MRGVALYGSIPWTALRERTIWSVRDAMGVFLQSFYFPTEGAIEIIRTPNDPIYPRPRTSFPAADNCLEQLLCASVRDL